MTKLLLKTVSTLAAYILRSNFNEKSGTYKRYLLESLFVPFLHKFEDPMINHIVLLEFKETLAESEIDAALNQLGNLTTIIPSIKDFSFGRNCSPEKLNKKFTHVFIMRFEDTNGRELYLNHSEHKRIAAEIIMPMLVEGLESVVVIDYEL